MSAAVAVLCKDPDLVGLCSVPNYRTRLLGDDRYFWIPRGPMCELRREQFWLFFNVQHEACREVQNLGTSGVGWQLNKGFIWVTIWGLDAKFHFRHVSLFFLNGQGPHSYNAMSIDRKRARCL